MYEYSHQEGRTEAINSPTSVHIPFSHPVSYDCGVGLQGFVDFGVGSPPCIVIAGSEKCREENNGSGEAVTQGFRLSGWEGASVEVTSEQRP